MSLSYIKRAEQGNRSALAFITTFILAAGGLFLGQSVPIYFAALLKAQQRGDEVKSLDTAEKLIGYFPFALSFSLIMVGFVMLLAFLWFGIKFFHRRKFATLWSDEDRFRSKEFFAGVFISLLIFVSSDLISYLISPSGHQWVFESKKYFIFLPLALIFIPIQTLAEELFFRGYIYQSIGLATKNVWLAWGISGILFGLFHFGNVEMDMGFWKLAIVYIGSGLMIGLSVLLSKGIEFGWGFHLINNLYLSVITNFPGGSLDGPTLYRIPKPSADRILVEFLVMFGIFALILIIRYRKNVKNLTV